MSERIPEGWRSDKFDQLCTLQRGFDLPVQDRIHGEYPVIGSNGIVDFHNKGKVLAPGVVTGRSGSIGKVWYLQREFWALNTSLYVKVFHGNNEKYVYYFLQYFDLSRFGTGTGVPTLNRNDVHRVNVVFPPTPEQQVIASILTSVDEVIDKTESQISKLQDLKKGMMQELLTKGIGHTEFKDSPVGRIPKGWNAVFLDSVSIRGSGHTPSKSYPEYWNGGIRWVSLSDSNKLDRLYISESAKEISQTGLDNSSAVLHPKGTVILSRDAGVGKSAIIGRKMAVSQHFMAWRCGEQLDNHYLYYLLQYWKPRFEGIAMGSTIQTIGLSYFKKLVIPLPPVNEQKTISKAFLSTDKRIFEIENKLHQIESLKKALMQDLLTGKVRVNVK